MSPHADPFERFWADEFYPITTKGGIHLSCQHSGAVVYLSARIDAIPKLLLTDKEMRRLRDLLAVTHWIRDLQQSGPCVDSIADVLNADAEYCQKQLLAARALILKLDNYLETNKVPTDVW